MGIQYRLRIGAALAVFAAIGGASLLSACDSGPSALPARDHSKAAVDAAASAVQDRPYEARDKVAEAETPLVDGKPIWASNRKHTAQENVDYQFGRNGADFGAKSAEAFAVKARDFIADPPSGVLTLKRSNGDRLIYDPKGNVFAVATRDGTPRTMFKPKEGQAYWDKQKAREEQFAAKSKKSDDDQG